MKFLIITFLLSFNVFAGDLNVKFEIVGFSGNENKYFDSFEIVDGKLYVTSNTMRREMGDISCNLNICSGGPFFNDYDMPEILSIMIVLDAPSRVQAIVFAVWDEDQVYQLQSIN